MLLFYLLEAVDGAARGRNMREGSRGRGDATRTPTLWSVVRKRRRPRCKARITRQQRHLCCACHCSKRTEDLVGAGGI